MTLFSSRPPFNDDPEPYRDPDSHARRTGFPGIYAHEWDHSPRPEYDRPQHNPTNPILTEFRAIYNETTPTIYQGYWELAEIWLELMDEDPFMRDPRNWGELVDIVEFDHYQHARKIFERLVAAG